MEITAAFYMHEIIGAERVMQGRARSISGVNCSPYRLRIRLTKPVGDFVGRLTMPFFCPILPRTPVNPAESTTRPGQGRTTWPSAS